MNRAIYHPILSCHESRIFEQRLFGDDKLAEANAMRAAGTALGNAVLKDLGKLLRENPRVLLVLGKGHNAGDAIIAARLLIERITFLSIDVLPLFGLESFDDIVESEINKLREFDSVSFMEGGVDAISEGKGHYGLMLDGVFGMQFQKPLSEQFELVFEQINSLDIDSRVAVDLPSGVCEENVSIALKSDYTYATGLLKKPLLLEENRKWCGRTRYLDIGFFEIEPVFQTDNQNFVFGPKLLRRSRSLRTVESDKRSYGHLLIIAGSRKMPGAMLMAVKAAVRSGVGLVSVVAPETVVSEASVAIPEAMWIPWPETADGCMSDASIDQCLEYEQLEKFTAILAGPGLGRNPNTQHLIKSFLAHTNVPLILDADALQQNLVHSVLNEYEGRSLVLTPHQGEYERLLFSSESRTEPPPDLYVVRKGPFTWIEHSNRNYFSPYGGPVLARGGSGDILAGLVAGKVANPQITCLLESVASAVALHGSAADALSSQCDDNHVCTTQILEHIS